MDHGDNDKRFYVYLHKDKDGNVRYVGSGSGFRVNNLGCRSKEHLEMWDELEKIIIKDHLTKEESFGLEEELLSKYWDSGLLFNKVRYAHKIRPIYYKDVVEYLYYDESSPTYLRWKKHRSKSKVDQPAGCGNGSGYVNVEIKGIKYRSHRVIWVLLNKTDLVSNMLIDHIDCNRSNNNISNLRLVTPKENNMNRNYVTDAKHDYVTISEEKGGKLFVFIHSKYDNDLGKIRRNSKSFVPFKLFPDVPEEVAIVKTREYLQDLKNKYLNKEIQINFKAPLKDYENNDIVFRFLSGVTAKELAEEYKVYTTSIWRIVNIYKEKVRLT